jgi:hypothetical protein
MDPYAHFDVLHDQAMYVVAASSVLDFRSVCTYMCGQSLSLLIPGLSSVSTTMRGGSAEV